jgi:hypothetical protein
MGVIAIYHFMWELRVGSSVRPKLDLGFGCRYRNQDQVSVSVREPKLFLPKPKLPPIYFP